MMRRGSFLTSAICLVTLPSLVRAAIIHSHEMDTKNDDCGGTAPSFDEFVQKHQRPYSIGSQEYQKRSALFELRAEEIRSHNCMPGKRFWTAGLTSLSDRTDAELSMLRGRKGGWSDDDQPRSGGGSSARERLAILESMPAVVHSKGEDLQSYQAKMPESFTWSKLPSMTGQKVIDQSSCGSCWASAVVAMLQAHADIYASPQQFSLQQLVSCAPNPQECGGNGGCNGSTGELALDYVFHNGLLQAHEFPYSATDIPCPSGMTAKNPSPIPQPMASRRTQSFLSMSPRDEQDSASSPARTFGMIGWSRLPKNELKPLYNALYKEGPVAISVVAGPSWNSYQSGIMNNCTNKDMVVNHLVVLIGYGADPNVGAKYWHIQNSWGDTWGEDGHIRMIRQDDATEEALCGDDNHPDIGTGCKGGPSKVYVCGSCGILYDNVVAHFSGSTSMAEQMLERRKSNYAPP